jgi:UDP-GlcNAc:undecaprenyl-phosphate/decaprenyl-phosphate GlcNAc-1-phosphate transferase
MLFIFAFIISLVVTMLLIPPVMKWADKIGAIDVPDARKVHTQAIPRVGGIAMVAGSVLSILLLAELDQQVIAILTGFLVIWGFGLWDDKCDLNYKVKFLGQLLAVVIVVTWGDVIVRTFPFIDGHIPDYLAIPLTIFALVGITNAINLSDGLDGLAGGTSLITISIIALLAYDAGGEMVVLISMAVAGSILGFLRHNTHPARLFMGDTGSQFLGFSLGVLVIVLSQSVNSAMSPLIPLFILGLPILDTMAVMGQRIYEKRSPFAPDKNHIHHKLLDIGFDQYEAVFIIYLLQSALVTVAYFMMYESDVILALIYVFISVFVLTSFHYAYISNWKFHSNQVSETSKLRMLIRYLRDNGWLTTVPTLMLKILVPLLLVVSAVLAVEVEQDMLILSMLLLVVLIGALIINAGASGVFEKAVVYIVSVIAIYLLPISNSDLDSYNIINWLFVLLVIAFTLRVRFSHEKTFQMTPLDYLVIILVLIIPNLPEVHLEDSGIGEMAVKLIVLFYASEAVIGLKKHNCNLIRLGTFATLSILIIRGF